MPKTPCSPPLPGPENLRKYLAHFGFLRSRKAGPWFTYGVPILAGLLMLLLLVALRVWLSVDLGRLMSLMLAPVVTFGLLLTGLWQWQGARQEISMDKYYDRLNISNQWWKSTPSVQQMMSESLGGSEDPEMRMYVCLEIDNLEYIIEKYRIGYVDDEQACRALRTFQIRCLNSPEFKGIAHRRIHLGDYTPRTAKVVCRVCEEVDNLTAHLRSHLFASGIVPERPSSASEGTGGVAATPEPPLPPAGAQEGAAAGNYGRRASDVLPFRPTVGAAAAAAAEGQEDCPPVTEAPAAAEPGVPPASVSGGTAG